MRQEEEEDGEGGGFHPAYKVGAAFGFSGAQDWAKNGKKGASVR